MHISNVVSNPYSDMRIRIRSHTGKFRINYRGKRCNIEDKIHNSGTQIKKKMFPVPLLSYSLQKVEKTFPSKTILNSKLNLTNLELGPDPNWAKFRMRIRVQIKCIWIHNTSAYIITRPGQR